MAERKLLSKEHHIYQMPNGRFYARPTISGIGRKEFALGKNVKTLKQAIAAKERKVAQLIRQNEPKPKSLIRYEDLCEEVIQLKQVKSFATQESAAITFRKHLIPWYNEHYPYVTTITEASWEEYVLAKQLKRPSIRLFNHWKHMIMVMRHAYKKGIIPRIMQFKNPDPERNAGKRLDSKEIARLLEHAGEELRLQVLMAVTMGMRKSEVLLLGWDRVNFISKTIHLRAQDTKIRRARTMGMSEPVYYGLKAALVGSDSPYVFPSRYNRFEPSRSNKSAWQRCKKHAEVKCRFHDLRHTFLSIALLEKKLNPLHVAVYAGVSLSEIQKTYLHPSVDDTREVAQCFGELTGEEIRNDHTLQ
jgi:integrase